MFSSNQIFDISCEFDDLPRVIKFAMELYGDEMFLRDDGRVNVAFSNPRPDVYAIGTGSMNKVKSGPTKGYSHPASNGWTDYPFKYDPEIIAGVVKQWVQKQPRPKCPDTDGSASIGVRIRSLASIAKDMPYSSVDLNWTWYSSILLFTPVYNVYDK